MALTPKREGFCAAYLRLGVAAKAYAESHDAKRMNPATIRKRAAELLKNPEVKARVAELQAAAAKVAVLDRASVLRGLERVVRVAMGDEPVRRTVTQGRGKDAKPVEIESRMVDLSAAVRAYDLIGKSDEIRLFVERHEHTGEGGAPLFEAPARDLARAVLDILRTAQMADKAQAHDDPFDDEPDEEQDGEALSASSEEVSSTSLAGTGLTPSAPVPANTIPSAAPRRSSKSTLAPGEREVCDNGAEITFSKEFQKFAVHDVAGRLHGYRKELSAARELAASIKPPPPDRKGKT